MHTRRGTCASTWPSWARCCVANPPSSRGAHLYLFSTSRLRHFEKLLRNGPTPPLHDQVGRRRRVTKEFHEWFQFIGLEPVETTHYHYSTITQQRWCLYGINDLIDRVLVASEFFQNKRSVLLAYQLIDPSADCIPEKRRLRTREHLNRDLAHTFDVSFQFRPHLT